jgi:hypothetical protein
VLYKSWPADGLELGDLFPFLSDLFKETERLPDGTPVQDSTDQLISLFARWTLPAAGIEGYLEWARNDFSGTFRDFLLEPEHSQAFTLGIQKAFQSERSLWRLRGEWTHLERSRTLEVRASPVYYVHGIVHQGYTHQGQLVGAHTGPGSKSVYLGLDRYGAGGRWGGFLQRVVRDNDAYYRLFADTLAREGHDVEYTAGASAMWFVGSLDVGATVALSYELNRLFRLENDVVNLSAGVSARWRVP